MCKMNPCHEPWRCKPVTEHVMGESDQLGFCLISRKNERDRAKEGQRERERERERE